MASDGNVYFVPDTGSEPNAVTAARVADPSAYSSVSGVVEGTNGYDEIDTGYTDPDGDQVGAGDDIVYAGGDIDDIYAGAGNDTLYGGEDDDWLFGEAGDDLLYGGTGPDYLVGGDGFDTISYDNSNAAVTVNLSTNSFSGGEAEGDTTNNDIEAVVGSSYGDTLTGTDTANLLDGGAGNDTLSGLSGDDTLYGGEGDDSIDGGIGNDIIDAGSGNDTVVGDGVPTGPREDVNWTDQGTDTDVSAGFSQDTGTTNVSVSFVNDGSATGTFTTTTTQYVEGSEGLSTNSAVRLSGNGTNPDTLTATIEFAAKDSAQTTGEVSDVTFRLNDIDAGAWRDEFIITAFDANNNPVVVTLTASGDDTVTSGTTATIVGATANDEENFANGSVLVQIEGPVSRIVIDYNNGNTGGQAATITDVAFSPILTSPPSDDSIDGGAGDDTLYGELGNDTLTAGTGTDTLYGGDGDDTLLGTSGSNSLYGGTGADTITGGTDSDTVYGGADADQIDGGDGSDILHGDTGNDTLTAGAGDDTLYGGDGNDTLQGSSGTNTLYGGAGTDSITGGTDTDLIYGGDANDQLDGGDGNDTLYGDAGDDTITAGAGNDLLLGGDGADTLIGTSGSNTLGGGAGADSILGGTGDDAIYGDGSSTTASDGADIIDAGAGNDQAYGGGGTDSISGGSGNDSLYGGDGDDSLGGGTGNDILSGGAGNDVVDGGDGDDSMVGGAGNDTLFGGTGNDVIFDADGNDTLYGGIGSDTFEVSTSSSGTNTVVGGENAGDLDILSGASSTEATTVIFSGNEAGTLTNASTSVTFSEIEGVETGNGNDLINASVNTDDLYLNSGAGDDTIISGSGSDTIIAGEGADRVTAGAGDDQINLGVDTDTDTVVLGDGFGNDTVTNFTGPTDNGDGTFTGGDQLDVSGLTDASGDPVNVHDVTVGNDGSGNAVLTFPNGETLTLTGVDPASLSDPRALIAMGVPASDGTISGTAGADIIDASYTGDPDGDQVDSADAVLPGVGQNDDIIDAGAGNDQITAGDGTDSILAGTGDDTVSTGSGSDTVDGGAGNDTINFGVGDSVTGGDGDDRFVLTDFADAGTDTITIVGGEGSETSGDVLDLSGLAPMAGVTITNSDDASGGLSGTVTLTNGTVLNFSEIEQIICFTSGTLIDTPQGPRPVETLRTGDQVITADHGVQTIRWRGESTVAGTGLHAPVRFAAGSLPGLTDDLTVSPQHKMLLRSAQANLLFGAGEVLAAARHLTSSAVQVTPVAQVTYIHLLFDRHELIRANGAWVESFQPGPVGLRAMNDSTREALFNAVPELRCTPTGYGPAARMVLRRFEAKLLAPELPAQRLRTAAATQGPALHSIPGATARQAQIRVRL